MSQRIVNIRMSLILAGLLLAACSGFAIARFNAAPVVRAAPAAAEPLAVDLTGFWKCDDGGRYYVRQVGEEVWWYGRGGNFGNVFHGSHEVNSSINMPKAIAGTWVDLPIGETRGSGSLTIGIVSKDQFKVVTSDGGFGGTVWNRLGGSSSGGNAGNDGGGGNTGNNGGGGNTGNSGVVVIKGEISWGDQADFLAKDRDKELTYRVTCSKAPADYLNKETANVFGSGPEFSTDSGVCLAAVFDGRIKNPFSDNVKDRTVTYRWSIHSPHVDLPCAVASKNNVKCTSAHS